MSGEGPPRPVDAPADEDGAPTLGTDPGLAAQPLAAPPTVVGPYRVVQFLGEGGMGTVYLAEQTRPIARKVALKVLRSASASAEALRRFEAEGQALARMSHPGVAQVYDAGTDEAGRPFLAMELVSGLPLTRHCDGRQLDLARRLELFVAVCEALQHAHHKGFIHRDVKPSNVLVAEEEGRPIPKVIDFGIAKALERSAAEPLTTGAMMGTPGYFSPESVSATPGDADTRTDVYSLGVLLCELLAGVVPFEHEGRSVVELARRVAEEDPPAPSARYAALPPARQEEVARRRGTTPAGLLRALRGDLDWIVVKAAARDRERRYSSAAELAQDVLRHARLEPVLAGPPALSYRASRFVRRHKALVGAAALLVLAVAGGVAGVSLEARRANREAAAARRAAAEAEEVVRFLVGLFEVSNPSQARGESVTAREVLDRGAERLSRELAGQPLTRARLLATIGTVYRQLGLYPQAEPLLRDSLTARRRLLGPDHRDVGENLHELGDLRERQGDLPGAERDLRQALGILEKALGPGHAELGDVLNELAVVRHRQGALDEAEGLYERALAIREKAHGRDSAPVAASLNNLALLHRTRGDLSRAAPLFERSLTIKERTLGHDHPGTGGGVNNLAGVFHALGDRPRAEALYRRALALKEKVLGPDHPDLVTTLNNLALLAAAHGDGAAAESEARRALAIGRARLAPDHALVAHSLNALSLALAARGDDEGAAAAAEEALAILERKLGPQHPDSVEAALEAGRLLTRLGRLERAEALLQGAVEAGEAGLAKNPESRQARASLGAACLDRGLLREREGESEAARGDWTRAAELLGPLAASSEAVEIGTLHARALLHLGRVAEATAAVRRLRALGLADRDLDALCRRHGLAAPR